jgi:hypothetical protein
MLGKLSASLRQASPLVRSAIMRHPISASAAAAAKLPWPSSQPPLGATRLHRENNTTLRTTPPESGLQHDILESRLFCFWASFPLYPSNVDAWPPV